MKLLITANGLQYPKLNSVVDFARARFDEVVLNPWGRRGSKAEIKMIWDGADAIVCGAEPFDCEMLDEMPKSVKVLSHYGVGLDSIDVDYARKKGIKVCNTPGVNSASVADMTMCLILASARQLLLHDKHTRAGEWKRFESMELEGKTIGLIGFGDIGQAVAKRAKAFGLHICAYDPFFNKKAAELYDVMEVELDYLLEHSDIISLHAPCTPETFCIINSNTLSHMKKSAILVNTARGALINEDDLYHALKKGQISYAGIDVYCKEPATKDNKLFELENTVFSPHCSANTVEASIKMGKLAVENAYAILSGLPCKYAVN